MALTEDLQALHTLLCVQGVHGVLVPFSCAKAVTIAQERAEAVADKVDESVLCCALVQDVAKSSVVEVRVVCLSRRISQSLGRGNREEMHSLVLGWWLYRGALLMGWPDTRRVWMDECPLCSRIHMRSAWRKAHGRCWVLAARASHG